MASSRRTDFTVPIIMKPLIVVGITGAAVSLLILWSNDHRISGAETRVKRARTMPPRSFILWLHGLGDSGPANEPIKTFFKAPQFANTKWSFPSAPSNPVSCNRSSVHVFNSQNLLHRGEHYYVYAPFGKPIFQAEQGSPKDGVMRAVQNVHRMIDNEIADGVQPENIFLCGFSQGGALTLTSVLLYPRTLRGGAVFSGWVPFNSSIVERIPEDAKKTPILWSHGVADQTVLFEAGQAGPPFLQAAGFSSCEFKAYPGLGHFITPEELTTLESWIKTRMNSSD